MLSERTDASIEKSWETILKLRAVLYVIPENNERVFSAARNTAFADFEDSMQNESALFAEVDYIITRNKKDFEKAAIPVVTTEEFLILANRRN